MGNTTMSVAEAAKHLGVHRNTVLNRIKTGALPAQPIVQPNGTKSYRIPIDALPNPARLVLHVLATLEAASVAPERKSWWRRIKGVS